MTTFLLILNLIATCVVLVVINRKAEKIMALIDDLQNDVTDNTSVVKSAITLLQNLHDLLVAAGTDPVKLQAIRDTLNSSKQELADAVAANTPAAKNP